MRALSIFNALVNAVPAYGNCKNLITFTSHSPWWTTGQEELAGVALGPGEVVLETTYGQYVLAAIAANFWALSSLRSEFFDSSPETTSDIAVGA